MGDKIKVPVGGTLLGVTLERIGTFGKVGAKLYSTSSTRRKGIDTCMAAGWGDIGYNNCWTLELTAFVRYHYSSIGPVFHKPFLIVGEPVAQMVFFECKSEPTKEYDGQYQIEWPLNMIPRRYRHKVVMPK